MAVLLLPEPPVLGGLRHPSRAAVFVRPDQLRRWHHRDQRLAVCTRDP